MGKMMENTLGRAVENLAKNAAEQIRATQQQSEQVQQQAAQAIESSKQLREYLGGGMQIAEPVSESSSMQSVNGQVSQTVGALFFCQDLTLWQKLVRSASA